MDEMPVLAEIQDVSNTQPLVGSFRADNNKQFASFRADNNKKVEFKGGIITASPMNDSAIKQLLLTWSRVC
jgi:hypothetical protein